MNECEFCGTTEGVTLDVDPYDQDVNNVTRYVYACDSCLTERAAEI